MNFTQNTIVSFQTTTSARILTMPFRMHHIQHRYAIQQYHLYDRHPLLAAKLGRTTTAITPSLVLPGVDVVIYESVIID